MTELEKIEALKKAYAEMILNAAKEAAARVMAAELKARRFEQDLIYTKEEAARLFDRSKLIIDAKTKEAEIKLSNQQTKFDELEFQLNETEGVILDLRAELNEAQEQLSKEKNKARFYLQQNENEKAMPEAESDAYELFTSSLDSGLKLVTVNANSSCPERSTLNLKNHADSECDVYSTENCHVFSHIKEPELFRNGCTQGNFAAVASLVNERSPPRKKSGPCTNSTNIENTKSVENASAFEEKFQHGKHEAVYVTRRSTRKRKVKCWGDAIATFGVRSSHQLKKPSRAFQHFSRWKSNKVQKCFKSGQRKCQTTYKTQDEESLDHVQEFPSRELKLAEYLQKETELIDVLVEQETENLQKEVELGTEDLEKDMELIDVLVEKDELAEMFDLNSSSSIVCDVEGATVTEASNVSFADRKENCNYTFSRKRKKMTN